jgi:isocitrate/isopropylmalate dehydrogenase
MMCEYGLGLPDAAAAIRDAVEQSFTDGICTADLLSNSESPAAGTTQVAQVIAGYII